MKLHMELRVRATVKGDGAEWPRVRHDQGALGSSCRSADAAPPDLPEGPWLAVSSATSTAWSGPSGVSYSANLTPDPETGLGKWTRRDFVNTIRTGRRMGRGRKVLPPMPISAYKNFNDEDLEAIFAYLQSVPAVQNRVPEPVAPGEHPPGTAN